MKDVAKSEKQLLEQLGSCPISEVIGIVDINGVSAGRTGGEKLWTLGVKLVAWRVVKGYLKTEPLHIRRKVTHEELNDIRNMIRPETIIKINARVIEESVFGRSDALFEGLIEFVSNDNELNVYLEELKKPIIYIDSILGTFTFNRQVNWYIGDISWNGKSIKLNLSVYEPEGINLGLQVAKTLWEDQVTWNNRVCKYAVHELLKIKNESWLEEEEDKVTSEQFRNCIILEEITINPNGEFEFWHNDGDLFWGHSILISGNLTDGPNDADITG
ncbi:DUF2262 domain-containing protein [Clostridium sp. CF011]|uniref:DUF2262 domain-containing protein n=1 Tax=Clostridium sp. CF011 TaxID=2843318 RepID=UPI001C0B2F6C|nr:DUF2262 domain-containing protein [Clostridium sp. CF011]MBU3092844.1 DUF2262 domain-containing protein [Clostridium sp. CF011]WAG71111.1 DUF2262 domain-containing protein [Clostridium sp. CF011]